MCTLNIWKFLKLEIISQKKTKKKHKKQNIYMAKVFIDNNEVVKQQNEAEFYRPLKCTMPPRINQYTLLVASMFSSFIIKTKKTLDLW